MPKFRKRIRRRRPALGAGMNSKKLYVARTRRVTNTGRPYSGMAGTSNSVFPRVLPIKMFYAEHDLSITASAGGAPGVHTFRVNSLYDFNSTGVGNQPRWMDTLLGANAGTTPYSRYLVRAVKVSITFYPVGITGAGAYFRSIVVPRISNSTAPTTLDEARVRFGAKSIAMASESSQGPKTVHKYIDVRKWWNRKDLQDDSDNFGAAYNANPTNQVMLDVVCGPIDKSINQYSQLIDIKATLYCQLYSLNDVADS